jgi:hypothetical protein
MPERSISVGGNVSGSSLVTGDHNVVATSTRTVVLPPPESVDIAATLTALRDLLTGLDGPQGKRIANALDEAADEAAGPEPDKDEIGKALTRAVDYASKANGFSEQIGKLAPHLASAVAWLGPHWHKLLALAGLGS